MKKPIFLYSQNRLLKSFFVFFLALQSNNLYAQTIPGNADPGRVDPFKEQEIPNTLPKNMYQSDQLVPKISAPKEAKETKIFLKEINLKGNHFFSDQELLPLYQEYLNQEITLDKLWVIVQKITSFYHNKGYFLSRSYVPEQRVDDGIVTIQIAEVYVSDVKVNDEKINKYGYIQQLITDLKRQQPVNAKDLESFMLRLNNVPDVEVKGILKPIEGSSYARGVQLVLESIEETDNLSFDFNNHGSRFLGPYQSSITYQDSFLPLQQTTLSFLTSLPADELRYGAIQHEFHFAPKWSIGFSGNYVASEPGYTLDQNDIASSSTDLGLTINYQPIYLRQENLIFSLGLSGRNTDGDAFSNNSNPVPLTRDKIRKVTFDVNYDTSDTWYGYNYINVGIHQGIKALGASKESDPLNSNNQSRVGANPEFTTLRLNYIRQQAIGSDYMAIGRISGQLASDPLLSAEEFGYGGQNLGRAYDFSELTGDSGLAGSIELRYLNIPSWNTFQLVPYGFYDIGQVWNKGVGEIDQSASSAGAGFRLNHSSGFNSNIGVAFPLTKPIDTPFTGNNQNPRILFQVGLSL